MTVINNKKFKQKLVQESETQYKDKIKETTKNKERIMEDTFKNINVTQLLESRVIQPIWSVPYMPQKKCTQDILKLGYNM